MKKSAKRPAAKKAAAKPRVASAAGSAAGTHKAEAPTGPTVAKQIEEAMAKAALKAQSEGISDPKEQKKLMLAAKDAVLAKQS
jgi:hypothetical protein